VQTGEEFPKRKSCITQLSPPGQRCLQPLTAPPMVSAQHFTSEPGLSGGYGYGSGDYDEGPEGSEGSEGGGSNPFILPEDTTICVDMSCSADGVVLINGEPCDPGTHTNASEHFERAVTPAVVESRSNRMILL
jgi:hypothetical protein